MEVYLIFLAMVLIFGRWMPQSGTGRKGYILLMCMLHTALLGLRHPALTGDLMKYHWEFLSVGAGDWTGFAKNPGFYLLMKLVYHLTGGNFQAFLFFTAAITQGAWAWVIWKECPAPWLSYLALHCLGFYVFGFSAVKQALAMALVLLAFQGIAENRPGLYFLWMALAGAVHAPMLIFLPAYVLTRFRVDRAVLGGYVLAGIGLYLLREPAAELLKGLYYGETAAFFWAGGPGGRFFLLFLITAAGVLLRGTEDVRFGKLLHLMAAGTLLQLLSGFGNLFTRLADVYVQFSVLYIPAMLCREGNGPLAFSCRSRKILTAVAAVCLIWFYWRAYLSVEIAYPVDDYWNYRFFWQAR